MEATPPPDPQALLRSNSYVKLLILAALLGVPVSALAYGFLELVDWLQESLFTDLPGTLGFDSAPVWWPLPLLALSGLLAGLAVRYLPGTGGHSPADGFKTGAPLPPIELPGVLLRRARHARVRRRARPRGAADRDGQRARRAGRPAGGPRLAADGRGRDVDDRQLRGDQRAASARRCSARSCCSRRPASAARCSGSCSCRACSPPAWARWSSSGWTRSPGSAR